MSWICWKEKVSSCSRKFKSPIFGHQIHWSGLDPDPEPDPQPCQKGGKSWCYLAELILLDHELDLLEGEAGSGSTDPTESRSNSDPDPQPCQKARKKLLCTLLNSFFSTMSWICWKEKLDPDPLTLLNPDPMQIRIRNTAAQKARKSCYYLAQLLLLDHELDLLEREAGSGSTDPTESGSNADPDPQHCCPESEKSCCYLAELLLDHELDLLEGEAVLLQPEVQIPNL
jgi:hypothetical protein